MKNNIFKKLLEKGYNHRTQHNVDELDNLVLNSHHIISEYANICEWFRVNHNIWIEIKWFYIENRPSEKVAWDYYFDKIGNRAMGLLPYNRPINYFNTPQEAYNGAFNYILNKNII